MTDRSVKKQIMSPRTEKQFEKIRQDRKKAILDAAMVVCAEEGYHNASMSMIAKRAGVSKGLIYNYFESKEELVKYMMIDLVDEVMHDMHLDVLEDMTRDDFIYFIEKGFELVLEDTQKWKLYMTVAMQPEVMALVMDKMIEKMQPYMIMCAKYFAKKGHEDPMVMMRYFSAVMDGVQFHIMMDKNNFPVEEVKKMIIKQFA